MYFDVFIVDGFVEIGDVEMFIESKTYGTSDKALDLGTTEVLCHSCQRRQIHRLVQKRIL